MRNLYIVFDLDDTLYLERDYVRSGFEAVGRWLEGAKQIEGFAACAWNMFANGARTGIFQSALSKLCTNLEINCVPTMLDIYRNHQPQIELCRDSSYCLATLGRTAYGLITDGRAEGQRRKCEALGLMDVFSPLICTGVWGEEFYKPHPRAFECAEQSLNDARGTLVYVADNPTKDFATPLARGWKTVRVRRAAGLHAHREALPSAMPHVEVPTLWELPEALKVFG